MSTPSIDFASEGQPILNDMERLEKFFSFLQGDVPPHVQMSDDTTPKLTPDQAWSVVWFLQEVYHALPAKFERCDRCGDLFDSYRGGDYDGEGPLYHFCGGDSCMNALMRIREKRTGKGEGL